MTASTQQCICDHPRGMHEGELSPQCEHPRCECIQYRAVDSRIPMRPLTLEQILRAGRDSAFKRTVTLAEKIAVELHDLRGRLVDEREAVEAERVAEARKAELIRELAAAEAAVAELRAKLTPARKSAPKPEEREVRPKILPCPVDPKHCTEMFESRQRQSAHKRWRHPETQVAS